MSHRKKNEHKPRHHTHAVKPASMYKPRIPVPEASAAPSGLPASLTAPASPATVAAEGPESSVDLA